jgi:altronate hydrolase
VTKDITPGDWLHEHNVAMHDFARDYRFCRRAKNERGAAPELQATVPGLQAAERQDRTRNYIGILTSVNCSARSQSSSPSVQQVGPPQGLSEIDGVVPLCTARLRHGGVWRGWDLLRRTQWGYATHPNLAAR